MKKQVANCIVSTKKQPNLDRLTGALTRYIGTKLSKMARNRHAVAKQTVELHVMESRRPSSAGYEFDSSIEHVCF